MKPKIQHVPVLKEAVQKYLGLKSGDVAVDATLGLGGHALDILEKIGKKGKLLAFEQDKTNLSEARERLKSFKSQIVYFHDNFRNLKTRITEFLSSVDAVLFDLGLSSPHVDDPERGFSFMKDGPLDMRFDQSTGLTAADVINTYPEKELSYMFWKYGEERMSRLIAKRVCEWRKKQRFTRTGELVRLVESVIPVYKFKHPATRVFQALRIEVNDELNALKKGLEGAFEILKSGGRLVVISYHSLEDRIVKEFFKRLQQPEALPDEALYRVHGESLIEVLTKKPVVPGEKEIIENPRSRSAKLRACKKI